MSKRGRVRREEGHWREMLGIGIRQGRQENIIDRITNLLQETINPPPY